MIITAAALAIALASPPAEAPPVEPTPYVLVMWESSATYPDLWPQKLVTSLPLAEPDLFALDGALPECGVIQIDLYWNNEVTTALIEGGVLHGAGNPPEALAYVLDGQDPWRVLDLGECLIAEPPTETPAPPAEPLPPITSSVPATLQATGNDINWPLLGLALYVVVLGVLSIVVPRSRH